MNILFHVKPNDAKISTINYRNANKKMIKNIY